MAITVANFDRTALDLFTLGTTDLGALKPNSVQVVIPLKSVHPIDEHSHGPASLDGLVIGPGNPIVTATFEEGAGTIMAALFPDASLSTSGDQWGFTTSSGGSATLASASTAKLVISGRDNGANEIAVCLFKAYVLVPQILNNPQQNATAQYTVKFIGLPDTANSNRMSFYGDHARGVALGYFS